MNFTSPPGGDDPTRWGSHRRYSARTRAPSHARRPAYAMGVAGARGRATQPPTSKGGKQLRAAQGDEPQQKKGAPPRSPRAAPSPAPPLPLPHAARVQLCMQRRCRGGCARAARRPGRACNFLHKQDVARRQPPVACWHAWVHALRGYQGVARRGRAARGARAAACGGARRAGCHGRLNQDWLLTACARQHAPQTPAARRLPCATACTSARRPLITHARAMPKRTEVRPVLAEQVSTGCCARYSAPARTRLATLLALHALNKEA